MVISIDFYHRNDSVNEERSNSGSLWTSGQTRLGLVAVSSQEGLGYAAALAAGVLRFLLFCTRFVVLYLSMRRERNICGVSMIEPQPMGSALYSTMTVRFMPA